MISQRCQLPHRAQLPLHQHVQKIKNRECARDCKVSLCYALHSTQDAHADFAPPTCRLYSKLALQISRLHKIVCDLKATGMLGIASTVSSLGDL